MQRPLAYATLALALFGAGYVVAQQKPAPEIRRVVTKLDASGKAVVMIDEKTRLGAPRPPNLVANLWVTDKSLPDFSWTEDRGKTKVGLVPPKSGTIFRVVDFAPESAGGHPSDPNFMMKIVGAEAPARGVAPRHPMMHRTRSLDYAIVMSGQIDILLDEGEVHLKAGDAVVQQTTEHDLAEPRHQPWRLAVNPIHTQET